LEEFWFGRFSYDDSFLWLAKVFESLFFRFPIVQGQDCNPLIIYILSTNYNDVDGTFMRANSQKPELQFTSDVVCCLLTWGIPYLDYILQLPISVFNDGLNHLNQIKMCLRNLIF